jgi:HSP20 family protein
MTLMRYNEFLPRFFDDNFTKEFDQLFSLNDASAKSFTPAVNVKEEKDSYQIEVAVPGMKKEDFEVVVDHDLLKISAKQEDKKEDRKDDGKYTRREFRYHSFERSFHLPKNEVNGDKINARYEDGILHIDLPKREEIKEKPTRLIEIA